MVHSSLNLDDSGYIFISEPYVLISSEKAGF